MGKKIKQIRVVTTQTAVNASQGLEDVAVFDTAGNPINLGAAGTTTFGLVKKMPAQVDTTAADLAALKVDFNALLAKLRTAGILT